jgi:serine phosphatase RsbU (regulator of sigma subunit)
MKKVYFISLIVSFQIIFISQITCAQKHIIDSLQGLLKLSKEDTCSLNLLNNIADELRKSGDYEKSLICSKKAINIAVQSESKGIKSFAILKQKARALNVMGLIYKNQGNYPEALKNQFAALKIREAIGDKKGIASSRNGIGLIYFNQGNYAEALKNHLSALKIREVIGDKEGVGYSNSNIGIVYQAQGNASNNAAQRDLLFDEALKNYFTSLKIDEEFNDKRNIAGDYNNIGDVYKNESNYNQALEYFSKSLKIQMELEDKQGIAICKINIGEVYTQQNKFEKGYQYLAEGLTLFKKIGFKDAIKETYSLLAKLFEKKHDFKQAFFYHKLFRDVKDTLLNQVSSKQMVEMNTKYDTEKKDKELIEKDAEINVQQAESAKQQVLRNTFITGFILMFVLAFIVLRGYRQKKKANNLLELKNVTISKQHSEIEKKNTVITDSIEYAKSIQQSILPDDEEIKKQFSDFFILYKPKDIVSGDFYWQHDTDDRILFAVADCTGHGVPGAFMSFMGYNLLEKIVTSASKSSPAEILEELNYHVLNVLKQKDMEGSAKFGMDISLISIDKKTKHLEYSGAYNSLYILRNQSLQESVATIKKDEQIMIELVADRRSVGSFIKEGQQNFANHSVQLMSGDICYMSTDGYRDQLGGPDNKKFFTKTFRELLKRNCNFDLAKQKEILEETILSWKGTKAQTDDILVVGIKI